MKQLQVALRGHKAVQHALAQSQRQVAGLTAQLDAAHQDVAAAQAASKAAESLRSRSAVLERAWTTALEVRSRAFGCGRAFVLWMGREVLAAGKITCRLSFDLVRAWVTAAREGSGTWRLKESTAPLLAALQPLHQPPPAPPTRPTRPTGRADAAGAVSRAARRAVALAARSLSAGFGA